MNEPANSQGYGPEEEVADSSSYTFWPPVEPVEVKYLGGEEKSDVKVDWRRKTRRSSLVSDGI